MGYGSNPSSSNPSGYGTAGYGQAAFTNNSRIKLQNVVNSFRVYPELVPVLGAGGFTQEPALTIANDVMQKILAQNFNWKFNRSNIPPFLTVALQQDYVTNINNMGWLEQGWRVDINNSTNNGAAGPQGPKPIFAMETGRDLAQTAYQANPFFMSWVPNTLAVMGTWQANTAYSCGYGVAQVPVSPIQQFVDKNSNILFIDSSTLNLSINSPGFTTTPIVLPTPNPYGVSGGTQPFAAVNAQPGSTVTDGTVTWTVADPNGYTIRIAPLPPYSGLCWLLMPVYQVTPPIFYSLQQTIAPIPDAYAYIFRQGFLAMCYQHAGSKMFPGAYQQFEESIITALRSVDRERDETSFYPSSDLQGGSPYSTPLQVGPSNPYNYGFGW